MNISYYTIDDLRLPPKRSLRKGRSVEQFSTLEEALARYQSLPAAGIRVLGLTDGIHVLELVKCLPLFPDDQEGEDVLASDYSCFPLWAQEPEAASATGACITAMGLRYEILTKQFIHRFNSTEKELLDELNMERSVFYDRKREALFLFSVCLFGYCRNCVSVWHSSLWRSRI